MDGKNKRIRLSGHARQQIRYRGATEADVIQTIHRSGNKQNLNALSAQGILYMSGNGMVNITTPNKFAPYLLRKKTRLPWLQCMCITFRADIKSMNEILRTTLDSFKAILSVYLFDRFWSLERIFKYPNYKYL